MDSSYYEALHHTVSNADAGRELKNVLRDRLGISRKLLSRLKLTEQGIMVNGVRVYVNYRVNEGDDVAVRMEREHSEDILPQPIPIDVLYEDNYLLAVNKPAGMIVHPTHGHYVHTLANAVEFYWQSRNEQFRFRPVQRLDQWTSGIVVIAKNPLAHQQIAQQGMRGGIVKEYIAFVQGEPDLKQGTVNHPIDRNPMNPHVRIVTASGYPSVTHYQVERSLTNASKLRLRLETGRTHQIRVHMQYIGHPLLGDKMYGMLLGSHQEGTETEPPLIERQALHHAVFGFLHPISAEPMMIEAPLPEDMTVLEQKLSVEH